MKDNTKLAYAPKIKEFKAFCDHVYPHHGLERRYTVGPDGLYRFLFYQVFREKKVARGRKRGVSEKFDCTDFDRVVTKYSAILSTLDVNPDPDCVERAHAMDPENPLGCQMINTYRSAIWNYYENQYNANANRLRWEEINTPAVKRLFLIVKGRKRRVAKNSYAEKVEGEASTFHSYSQIVDIEQAYWLEGCGTSGSTVCPRKIHTSLRNRYNFLMNFTGLLRNESICMSELSDCRHFYVNRTEDHDPMLIFLLYIGTGKTVKSDGPSQYGRATRHRDVFQCSVGALGFYLLHRFWANGEFLDLDHVPDFRDNASWFDTKVLCEFGGDVNQEMGQRSFQDSVKKIFKHLGISAKHFGHWGRVAGSIFGEFHELPPDMIKLLGKSYCWFVLLIVLVLALTV